MKTKIPAIIIVFFFLIFPASAMAATLSFQPEALTSPQSGAYTVTVVLNTEGENVNAVEGTVVVNSALGSAQSVTDSGSVITYWVKNPAIDSTGKTIAFSGAIPGGYSGASGILFSLVLPKYSGEKLENAINFSNIKVYRNDGLGTPAKVSLKSFAFSSSASAIDPKISDQLYIDDKKPDNIPPEIFSPQVAQDPRVFNGQWFLNFATVDKQSGIDYYEVQESVSGDIDAGRWKVATSPYLLQDQSLHSYIYVIAVDRQGNERIIKVFPRSPLTWWQQNKTALIIFAVILGLFIISSLILKKRNAKITNA